MGSYLDEFPSNSDCSINQDSEVDLSSPLPNDDSDSFSESCDHEKLETSRLFFWSGSVESLKSLSTDEEDQIVKG